MRRRWDSLTKGGLQYPYRRGAWQKRRDYHTYQPKTRDSCAGTQTIEDAATERVRDMEEVRAGLMLPREFRQKWFDETPDAAMASLAELKGGE